MSEEELKELKEQIVGAVIKDVEAEINYSFINDIYSVRITLSNGKVLFFKPMEDNSMIVQLL